MSMTAIGMAAGMAAGFAGYFGGFGAFVVVVVLGLIGFVLGRIADGDLEMADLFRAGRGESGDRFDRRR
ncbi:hypothetical protein [Streptomyces aculeolatus]|uniref:hypothetical protein n=1 Tax=Streptomyces aculeolatus TaxID=270689 RepID=UPI001CEDFCF9|nr:hypothetical protein [Streptomyces aculeolatus]